MTAGAHCGDSTVPEPDDVKQRVSAILKALTREIPGFRRKAKRW